MIRLKYHERPAAAVVLDEVVATLTPWSSVSRPDIALHFFERNQIAEG